VATIALRLVLPASLVLAVAAAGTCYYYWRVTGSPFRMPYQEAATSTPQPAFSLGKAVPVPAFRHQQMRNFMKVGNSSSSRRRSRLAG
jgi:hypothetical protein